MVALEQAVHLNQNPMRWFELGEQAQSLTKEGKAVKSAYHVMPLHMLILPKQKSNACKPDNPDSFR